MSVHIAIMTCSARWGMAERLAERIGGNVPVVYDDGGGCWETARRCWEKLANRYNGTGLVLQDDAAVCADFRESVEAVVAARPDQAIGLYSHRRDATARALARGESWFTIPGGAWEVAVCLPLAWVPDMLAWLDDPNSYCSRFKKSVVSFPDDSWYDRRVGAFLRARGRRLHCTVPSLVEHLGNQRSLLGHNNRNSHAAAFIGEDVSGLSIDWGGPSPTAPSDGGSGPHTLRGGTFQDVAQLLPLAKAEGAWIKDYRNGRWVIAEDGHRIVGCGCVWRTGKGARLSSQFVVRDHRGRGLNTAITERCIRRAIEDGAEWVEAYILTDPKGPYEGWSVIERYANGIRKVRTLAQNRAAPISSPTTTRERNSTMSDGATPTTTEPSAFSTSRPWAPQEFPADIWAKLDAHPVNSIRWVSIEKVKANDWNPNKVAPVEMHLLYLSIKADGYTQPVVAIYDEEQDEYVVVDGFHRYRTMLEHKDIRESTGGLLPVVVISGGPNELRASTIRHNRARGKHGIANMAQIVFDMLDNGWTETEVCRELGMSADEIVRLKHVTGFARLFEGVDYRRAWETKRMAKLRREWQAEHPGEPMP